jgi:hypothetical protein
MALQTSGAISLNDIHVEAGGTSGTNASINDSDIRALISKASGATMSFSEWYGATAYTAPTIDTSLITSPSANGFTRYRVDDGVTEITGQTTDKDVPESISLNTSAGRSLVLTIHVRDDDNSGSQDRVFAISTGASLTIDSSQQLVDGLTASTLLTTISTSGGFISVIGGQPDRGDSYQVSLRFTIPAGAIGGTIRLQYRDDPGDDDSARGINVSLS